MNKFGVIQRVNAAGQTTHVARPYDPAVKKHVWLGTRTDELEAIALVIEHFKGRSGKGTALTCGELIDRWLEEYVPTLKPKTRKTYKYNVRPFRRRFADTLVDQLDSRSLQLWANDMPKGYVACGKNAFAWGVEQKLVDDNPLAQIKVRRSELREVKPLTAAQVRKLSQTSFEVHREPHASMWAALILFMAGTGLRPNELDRLKWEDIDFRAGVVYVEPSKNWKDGTIVLLSIAREGLDLIPRGMKGLVFTNSKGKAIASSGIHYRFDPIRRAAGMPDFKFKELRHTCGTYLAEQGAAAADIAMQLRHSDYGRTAERHYIRPAQNRSMDRVRELDSVASAAPVMPISVASGSHGGGEAA